MARLSKSFFSLPTPELAKQILGKTLIHQTAEGITSGRIVETEAYLGNQDPAAHSFRGITPRTQVLFGPAGHVYIYFIYGIHYCLNVVSGPPGTGEAVLIRALEPKTGIPLMQQRRHSSELVTLCNGPAKLVQALGITSAENALSFITSPILYLEEGKPLKEEIVTTTRIGISKATELPLRYYLKGNPFVSRL